MFQLTNTRF